MIIETLSPKELNKAWDNGKKSLDGTTALQRVAQEATNEAVREMIPYLTDLTMMATDVMNTSLEILITDLKKQVEGPKSRKKE